MDTHIIYEKIMLDNYFNKMKYIRNGWKESEEVRFPGVNSLVDISGKDHLQYDSIMHRCSEIIYDMLDDIIRELIISYAIPVKYYDLRTAESDVYYFCEGEDTIWTEHKDMHKEKRILAFSRTDSQQEVLFIFKKFGINNHIPKKTLEKLEKAAKLDCHFYVSYVENEAYAEIINHSKNENDPTRGTGILSYKQFIEGFFGKKEYAVFKEYAHQFSVKVREYFGFGLLKTLKPNALFNFKKLINEDLKSLTPSEIDVPSSIDESQRKIIEKNFFDNKNYEILLGNSDFAQSYMTAEWLHKSLVNAGNIDMTAISMGYFKAIEQLLFAFLKNHTLEIDGCNREVYVGKGKPYANEYGYVQLTDSLIADSEKSKELTLGSLTGFFGYHDTKNNRYFKRNQDLLAHGINDITYEFIIETLGKIAGLRNEYFHKSNLKGDNPNDRNKIEDTRKKARLVFYIMLGAFHVSEEDKTRLGLIRVEEHDDFYRLCEYVNQKAYEPYILEIPIVYTEKNSDPYAFVFFYRDDYIEHDNYGEPIYSGIYFREFGKDGRIFKLSRDNLPQEIWEGTLVISETLPLKMTPSGAKKKIFTNGKFVYDL